jgi:hypothetical protein
VPLETIKKIGTTLKGLTNRSKDVDRIIGITKTTRMRMRVIPIVVDGMTGFG